MDAGMSQHSSEGLKAKDVCQRMGIQPYVLKFWESEFPQLGKLVGYKRVYGEESLAVVEEIHRLVEEERLTLGQARKALAARFPGPGAPEPSAAGASGPSGVVPQTAPAQDEQQGLFKQAESRIRELTEQLQAAETASEESAAASAKLEESLAAERQHAATLAERVTVLEAQLSAAKRELSAANERVSAAAGELSAAAEGNKEALRTNAELQARVETLEEQIDEYERTAERETAAAREAIESRQALQHKADRLQEAAATERAALVERNDALRREAATERDALRADVDDALAELRALLNQLDGL